MMSVKVRLKVNRPGNSFSDLPDGYGPNSNDVCEGKV